VESVNELAQIMKDLSVLVIDQVRNLFPVISPQLSHISRLINLVSLYKQGTIVDRIDYNIQSVATTVEEGLKQLEKVLSSFLIFHFIRSFFFFFFFFSLSLSLSLSLSSFI
jgi:t-SNARE complex subunit (syntaxin)